ncbi:Cytosol aminopeptidase [Zhongshania aliphaticivorans]|uniref:Probable cytosol aminopeptidase n=1 Tax=Zhongshania aliphaticivorans TaxID=1470434 RepID=A0A5S9QCH1_9GAMM|nr:leucyl aminopeptidase [Zhongshania aliphaticivorans]CAA0087466.1 Cytosol aminopeptidase [Zhongshania aliphaticivorans]CAA0114926.1 Cytosol aminopeptidase [Zhongshania aliphaticivorans]CAA0119728.1 Cytosol aminopeptidase [Zhongshania aliphaticivorans]
MQISLKPCKDVTTVTTDCLMLIVDRSLNAEIAKAVDSASGNTISQLIKRGDFNGDVAETLYLPSVSGIKAQRLLLIGNGNKAELKDSEFDKVINAGIKEAAKAGCKDISIMLDATSVTDRKSSWQYQRISQLIITASYRYTATLSNPKSALSIHRVTLQGPNTESNRNIVQSGASIGKGINIARNLGDLPGNICTPNHLASEARALGRKYDSVTVSVLDEKKMSQLGMHSLLSVTAGTDQPARLIVIEHKGGKKTDKPHVLVGKGITFDTGGISLKPGAKMDEMKYDMCGAASVVGTMNAIAEMGLKVNAVGIIAAAENMPNGNATKPGDVVKSMSGQTIEVLNTDAEGRLVLCDALTYAGKFKPASVIDIATLTGACVVALGKHASGLFSNSDEFAAELLEQGKLAQDRAWHMPLWDDYQQQLDSNFADIANIGGPEAGSVTAACFLSRFTKDYRWAHLDIAGAAWNSGANKGATGRPVALLCQYLASKVGK